MIFSLIISTRGFEFFILTKSLRSRKDSSDNLTLYLLELCLKNKKNMKKLNLDKFLMKKIPKSFFNITSVKLFFCIYKL